MILHLLPEEKITSMIISTFEEAFPQKNIFLCDTTRGECAGYKDKVLPMDQTEYSDIASKGEVDFVVIHYLNTEKIDFINRAGLLGKPIFWVMWGGDFYNAMLHEAGFRIYPNYPFNAKYFLKNCVKKLIGWHSDCYKRYTSFIQQAGDITMVSSQDEFALAKVYLPKVMKNVKNNFFFYYPIDTVLGALADKSSSGDSIIIGNSASRTNNHPYVFKYLSKLNPGNRQIITPLSYSGTEEYRNQITVLGQNLFRNNYRPLLNFMTLDEYNRLLLTANVYIYGNWRQEAMGNILVALYIGAKVFLSRRSPLMTFFRNMGITIFELEKITQQQLDAPLPLHFARQNKAIIQESFNRQRQIELCRSTFKLS